MQLQRKRPIDPAIGRRLAKIRIHRSCSEQVLAAELGVHKSTIGKWENGHTRLSTSWLPQIARALACTLADLLAPPGSPIPPARGPLPAACRGVNPGRPKRTTKRKRVPRKDYSDDL
jgi:transcriptional regulator with XRE-family HTH domain